MPYEVCYAIALSLIAVAPISFAWVSPKKASPQSPLRSRLFAASLIAGALSALLVCSCFLDPFPLIADGRGGYSDIRNFRLVEFAVFPVFAVILLSLAGRGKARILLLTSGILQICFWYLALLARD
ncbi:MAG TPA: hypothetical protein VHX60_19120 [Acidobacteriaceae bacterium]|jgi:hypothetical protein|nr:hypothetical protein [Acidobacteriaceae bacterium]